MVRFNQLGFRRNFTSHIIGFLLKWLKNCQLQIFSDIFVNKVMFTPLAVGKIILAIAGEKAVC
jgi:hypothetical protein